MIAMRLAASCLALGLTPIACTPDVSLGYWVDPSAPDASAVDADRAGECRSLEHEGACQLSGGIALPEDLTAEPVGVVSHFAGGAALPSGRYRLQYVDGCTKYDLPGAGWTLHGALGDVVQGNGAYWVIDEADSLVALTPGTGGVSVGTGPYPFTAYATYEECVAANCALPSVAFDFGGGVLGLRLGEGIPFAYISGDTAGGRAPTFRLSRLDSCL
jgi:hypothetical protein